MKRGNDGTALDMLSANDVAKRLGLGRARIYQLIAEKAIPFVRIGGRIRIPSAAWAAWLEQQENRALAQVAEGGDDNGAG